MIKPLSGSIESFWNRSSFFVMSVVSGPRYFFPEESIIPQWMKNKTSLQGTVTVDLLTFGFVSSLWLWILRVLSKIQLHFPFNSFILSFLNRHDVDELIDMKARHLPSPCLSYLLLAPRNFGRCGHWESYHTDEVGLTTVFFLVAQGCIGLHAKKVGYQEAYLSSSSSAVISWPFLVLVGPSTHSLCAVVLGRGFSTTV